MRSDANGDAVGHGHGVSAVNGGRNGYGTHKGGNHRGGGRGDGLGVARLADTPVGDGDGWSEGQQPGHADGPWREFFL